MRIVSKLNSTPTGYCIQPLAIRIHSAERLVPIATSQVTTRCLTGVSRSQPKKNRPTNVDSRKNAIRPFDRERRAEDVADVVRVVGPVGAELELHRHAGRDAHREVDAEQHAPELGHALPDLAPGHHVDRFHDRQHPRPAQRERHEQEVVERGERELQARQVDDELVDHGRAGAGRAARRGASPPRRAWCPRAGRA